MSHAKYNGLQTHHLVVAASGTVIPLQHMRTVLAQQLLAGRVQLLGGSIVRTVLLLGFLVAAHAVPDAVAVGAGGGHGGGIGRRGGCGRV